MRFSFGAVVLMIFAAVISVTAQKRTITNADLEKYRQERMRAEKEYMDTYERLGRPSPEELRRQRDESLAATARVAEMLMQQELEREQMELQRDQFRHEDETGPRHSGALYNGAAPGLVYGAGYGFGGYGEYFGSRGTRRNGRPFAGGYQQPYYVGGGSIWPVGTVGPLAPSSPGIRIQRVRPRR
jgi:hypothetical protein